MNVWIELVERDEVISDDVGIIDAYVMIVEPDDNEVRLWNFVHERNVSPELVLAVHNVGFHCASPPRNSSNTSVDSVT
jgi:hypothetical protein